MPNFPGIMGSIPCNGLVLCLDYPTTSNVTKAYQNLTATGTGTSGTTSITASGTITNLIQPGMKLRIGGTDIYTVVTASAVTITTQETLSTNYVASAMALDRVSQWNDTSGQGNHATQGTASSQPIYTPALINSSKASTTWDGLGKFVLPSTLYTVPGGNNTIFAVSNSITFAVQQGILFMEASGSSRLRLGFGTAAGAGSSTNSKFGNGPFVSDASAAGTNANFQILTGYRSGTTQSMQINNGTAVTNTNGANGTSITTALIGTNNAGTVSLTGNIAKILLYNRALAASEIVRINKILSLETAIVVS